MTPEEQLAKDISQWREEAALKIEQERFTPREALEWFSNKVVTGIGRWVASRILEGIET